MIVCHGNLVEVEIRLHSKEKNRKWNIFWTPSKDNHTREGQECIRASVGEYKNTSSCHFVNDFLTPMKNFCKKLLKRRIFVALSSFNNDIFAIDISAPKNDAMISKKGIPMTVMKCRYVVAILTIIRKRCDNIFVKETIMTTIIHLETISAPKEILKWKYLQTFQISHTGYWFFSIKTSRISVKWSLENKISFFSTVRDV